MGQTLSEPVVEKVRAHLSTSCVAVFPPSPMSLNLIFLQQLLLLRWIAELLLPSNYDMSSNLLLLISVGYLLEAHSQSHLYSLCFHSLTLLFALNSENGG